MLVASLQRIEYKLSPRAPDWSGAGLRHQPAHAGHQHSITLFTAYTSATATSFIQDRAFSVAVPRPWKLESSTDRTEAHAVVDIRQKHSGAIRSFIFFAPRIVRTTMTL